MEEILEKRLSFAVALGTSDFKHTGTIWRCLLAELIGTFLLVVISTAGCTAWPGGLNSTVQGPLTVGLTAGAVVQTIGHVSGAHINPAVTAGFIVSGHIRLLKSILYISCQLLGALLGSVLVKAVTPTTLQGTLCSTALHPALTQAQGVLTEAATTFVLMLVLQAVSDKKRKNLGNAAPLAAALAISAGILATNAYTGGSLNPARSFGPAVISNTLNNLWIYFLGPISGAVAASFVYMLVLKAK